MDFNNVSNIGPFSIHTSFKGFKTKAEESLTSNNKAIRQQAKQILELFSQYPILENGFSTYAEVEQHQPQIDELMAYIFPATLATNEIKCAVLPYTNQVVYASERMRTIQESSTAETPILQTLFMNNQASSNYVPYAIILNKHYGYQIDFAKDLHLKVPTKDGEKTYRVAYNADFLTISPNGNAVDISEKDVTELLANANDPNIWAKYFPENSWTIEGFAIINMLDVTLDEQFDAFKTRLIQPNTPEQFLKIRDNIRDIFGNKELELGVMQVNDGILEAGYDESVPAFSLANRKSLAMKDLGCDKLFNQLTTNHTAVIVSNIDYFVQNNGENRLCQHLSANGIKSLYLLPLLIEGELRYIMEVVSPIANQLNIINFSKLKNILPFIQSYSERITNDYENQISAIIQRECTSIHPAVEWRFEEEAINYIQQLNNGEQATFQEVVFENVYPLYGQIDIVGSSKARNKAIQEDLSSQLKACIQIFQQLTKDKELPLYEQKMFQCEQYLQEIELNFQTNTEQSVNQFFRHQILPLFEHLSNTESNNVLIKEFLADIDTDTQSHYIARKQYDETVNAINKRLANFLELQQVKAQEIFPHYFEKYKTDGVEHNLYVGQSMVKNKVYHPSVLFNLRLWQLQVMCEMEAKFYTEQKLYPIDLKVASLILSYDVPITIRYRIDEKQFDVDGSYNVRYEMIKKRIDKAHIKNTDERITQPNKLCVVYSDPTIEHEYLSYFEFLQSKGYIGEHIEIVELEELQGASGLKAIRAEINHNLSETEQLFSVEDIEIEA